MNFSESARVEKKIGFTSGSVKTGKVSSEEVKSKFSKLFTNTNTPKKSKFTMVNGIPHKSVDGKLVPLTPVK